MRPGKQYLKRKLFGISVGLGLALNKGKMKTDILPFYYQQKHEKWVYIIWFTVLRIAI
jgi:hypothetical protein